MNTHDILDLLTGSNDAFLFARAHEMRRWIFGNEVFLRAIIEFSNVCDKQCRYCGLRAGNRHLNRYRMNAETILESVDLAVAQGAGTVVLQSGDDTAYSMETVGGLIRSIKERHDVAVTLSLGDRGLDEYAHWRDCGADRCLIKLETTDPARYKELRKGESFTARLHRVEELRRLGYEVGSGVIVGLPGATLLDAVRDILFLTELDLDMIAVGPFVPTPDTPLASFPPGSVILSQRMTALLRLLNPKANIPATSALDALRPDSRAQALARGCNVLMPSITPAEVRGDYTIYPGKNADGLDRAASLDSARQTIAAMGFVSSAAKGFSPRRDHVE
ncbi:[FeFe] hydrogenase H-cluster radical SAM maturase HydE [Desulfovibrio caledoniensis]